MPDGTNPETIHTDPALPTTFVNFVLGAAGTSLLRNWYADDAHERRAHLIELAAPYASGDLLQFPVPTDETVTAMNPAAGQWPDSGRTSSMMRCWGNRSC